MVVVSSFRRAIGAVVDNPLLFAGAFGLAAVGSLLTAVSFVAPLLQWPMTALQWLLGPLFVTGVLAMAVAALEGSTSVDDFVAGTKAYYVRVLVTTVAFNIANSVAMFVWGIAVGIVAVLVLGMTGGFDPTGPGTVALLLVGGGTLVIALLPAFLLQFFAPAVVIEDAEVIEAFKRSVAVVRGNVRSTLGFDLLSIGLSALVGLPVLAVLASGLELDAMRDSTSMLELLGPELALALVVAGLVAGTVVGAIRWTYAAAFYRQVTGQA